MKPFFIIAVGIAVMLVVGAFLSGAFNTKYWETETEFGQWGEEILIEYVDGTTQSLKMIQDSEGKLLGVFYQGQEIDRLSYIIYGKATGEGYGSATVDIDTLQVRWEIERGSSHNSVADGEVTLYLNQETYLYGVDLYLKNHMNGQPHLYPDGSYVIKFTPLGSVRYKGNPGGNWKQATLPPGKSITVTVDRGTTAQIVVTLTQDVESQRP